MKTKTKHIKTLLTFSFFLFCCRMMAQDVTTYAGIAGVDGQNVQSTMSPTTATYFEPFSIAWDSSGRTWIIERSGNRVRVIYGSQVIVRAGSPASQAGTTNGAGVFALFNAPQGVVVSSTGALFISDGQNSCIRTMTAFTNAGQSQFTTDFAGKNGPGPANKGFVNDTGIKARFNNPTGMVIDKNDNIYLADAGNHAIRKITPGGVVTTVAGTGSAGFLDGDATVAKFIHPVALCFMGDDILLVADQGNKKIRKINLSTNTVSTLAGDGDNDYDDGPLATASFSFPSGVAYDDSSGYVYVTDAYPVNRIRILSTDSVKTYAGNPNDTATGSADGTLQNARFNNPQEIRMYKGYLYVCDADNHTIRKVVAAPKPGPNVGLGKLGSTLEILLFPNPSNGIVHFQSQEPVRFMISNTLGEMVYSGTSMMNGEIDLSKQSKGIYFCKAISQTGVKSFRLELID